MDDPVILDGETYISSRRASEFSGYARDYVGYLARRGEVDARQIGGLWYISQRSLASYQKRIEEFTPEMPSSGSRRPDPDTIVSFDGKDYISVPRGAVLTGYHQDYVGQLARNSKILSRQIGKRWYIERGSLLGHKREKDALLAAVQSESVGLSRRLSPQNVATPEDQGGPYMNYTSDAGDLVPMIESLRRGEKSYESRFAVMPISADISGSWALDLTATAADTRGRTIAGVKRSTVWRHAPIGTAAATIVIVIAIGYISMQSSALYANVPSNEAGLALAQKVSGELSFLLDVVENAVAGELRYTRAQ